MADEAHATYRVAVASSDGETVNQHYGRAEKFFIYVVDDDEGYDVCEERDVSPVCMGGSHVKSAMDESVRRFADCRYVVASRIGAGAAQALTAAGIVGMELPGSIEEAIVKVWKYNRVQGLFNIE
ncbi:MAG: dinitrogenase iron-molybdenum cofactor biosynthesis protein [Treponema sp.]|nr:dinitrogenase iron-molybdenum cofactor biosynthesis protein [Treponema sp.]